MVLPVPDGPAKSAFKPLAHGQLAVKAPLLVDLGPVLDLVDDLAQLPHAVGGQHDVVPDVVGRDLARQLAQLAVGLEAAGRVEIRRGHLAVFRVAPAGQVARRGRRVLDLSGGEAELGCQRAQVHIRFHRHVAVERHGPELAPFGVGRARELDAHERQIVQRVRRLPDGVAGQDGQARSRFQRTQQQLAPGAAFVAEQGVESLPVDHGLLQQRLALEQDDGRFKGQFFGVEQLLAINDQQPHPRLAA